MLVIGSQAIIGSHPELVKVADRWVYALSWMTYGGQFAESNDGAYADPVAEGVATLPSGWRDRLILFETSNMLTPNNVQARMGARAPRPARLQIHRWAPEGSRIL